VSYNENQKRCRLMPRKRRGYVGNEGEKKILVIYEDDGYIRAHLILGHRIIFVKEVKTTVQVRVSVGT
jgi:hypothetical protein